MTVGELYSQVSQLGFEDALENDDRFYYAANRALLQVNTVRPATKTLVIDHKPPHNLIKSNSFKPIEKISELTFEAEKAKAYYFEADGIGIAYLERYDGNTWSLLGRVELDSRKSFIAYKGYIRDGEDFVSGRVRLRFTGEYIYSVRNVAMYEHLYSNDVADIPTYEPYTRYDVKTIVDDFLAFVTPPIVEDADYTRLNQGYEIESGSVLLLPYDKGGVYKVRYKNRPKAIENTGEAAIDAAVIDLDEELCYAMPNLIASYIWAEDEPELSNYYLSLYRERVGEIRATDINASPAIYRNTNGW